jgi:hypothetical protein
VFCGGVCCLKHVKFIVYLSVLWWNHHSEVNHILKWVNSSSSSPGVKCRIGTHQTLADLERNGDHYAADPSVIMAVREIHGGL